MHDSSPTLLYGRVVLSDGDSRNRYLLIRDGKIQRISRSRPPEALVGNAKEVMTGPQDWIFPGLLDLHTHASYNILPLWRSPRAPFANRFEWRADARYQQQVRGVLDKVSGPWRTRQVFSELQAVAGGTCVLDQNHPLDAEEEGPRTVLCRDTGGQREMGLPDGKHVRAVVDFFRPGAGGTPAPARGRNGKPAPIDAYVNDRASLQAILVHLAEGRSGFGSDRGVDPYSRAEFAALMAHPSMVDIEAVRASRLSIVHGCGVDVEDPAHIDFLVERGIGVIWSPASNFLLYGDTLDAETLIDRGVTVALGSDWSPSGSKHVWEEAKFARHYLRAIGSETSDAEVFKMVTMQPARLLGLPQQFGAIEEGASADLFLLRSPIESDSALEVFFATSDKNVLATVIDGLPLYGDREFLSQWDLPVQPLPEREGSAVENKVLHLPDRVGVEDFAGEIDAVEDQLKDLDPPVYRSNLLVDSDPFYQRRFHALRARTDRFGWSVGSWRKHRGQSTIGAVLSPPDALRLHVRVATGERAAEVVALGSTRLPATVALGQPVGLTCHTVALLPASAAPGTIEAGLTAYEEGRADESGRAATLAGRIASILRSEGDGDWSGTPRPLAGVIEAGTAYSLKDTPIDWYVGETRLIVWRRRADTEEADLLTALAERLTAETGDELGWDGALVAVVEGLVYLWAHAPQGRPNDLPEDLLADVATDVMQRTARAVDAKGGLLMRWNGVDLRDTSDLVRLQFTRSALISW